METNATTGIDPAEFEIIKKNLNSFFVITMGLLIFFMQLGVALYEAGSVRAKNTTNVLLKNLLDMFFGGLAYWAIGYGLGFGEKSNAFMGTSDFFIGISSADKLASWFFHYSFAATAATIVSGAMAERTNFLAYIIYSTVITGLVYPIVSHWAWTETGWLAKGDGEVGYRDFAGSGVVHMIGGSAALVGAPLVGPRLGRFDENGRPVKIFGHTIPLAACGGFILLFGFLAFNGGSVAHMTGESDMNVMSLAIINSILAACASAITSLLLRRLGDQQKWSFLAPLNGSIAGMVAVCAGCNVFEPFVSLIIGTFAGAIYVLLDKALLRLRIDDPINASPVHLGVGFWGVVACPLFDKNDGVFYNGTVKSFKYLGWNILGGLTIFAWTSFWCGLIFTVLRKFNLLRVPREIELKGLDVAKHGEPAYPPSSYGDGWLNSIAGEGGYEVVEVHEDVVDNQLSTDDHHHTSRKLSIRVAPLSEAHGHPSTHLEPLNVCSPSASRDGGAANMSHPTQQEHAQHDFNSAHHNPQCQHQ